ncbi:hypothetical protein N9P72_00035 [Amylibacter sp.]|nr:hypothetical protein [Amylibacter sp.]
MKKIVYLIEQPLSVWNYNRFGIERWLDRGWNVEVWDLTQLLNPHVFEHFINSGKEIQTFSGYFPIATEQQLENKYKSIRHGAYYLDTIGNGLVHARIKKHLAKMGIMRIMSYLGFNPVVYPRGGTSNKLADRIITRLGLLLKEGPLNGILWFINKLRVELASLSFKPKVIVVSGEESIPENVGSASVVNAHNLDYDLFLKLNSTSNFFELIQKPYAVFLDQDVCFHSDWIFGSDELPVKPEDYFPRLCSVLRDVSKNLGYSLCIAGHPRSARNQKYMDCFNGIRVEYGVTAELVKNSSVVICHNSTAIQWAVLFKKPLIFLTEKQLIELDIGDGINVMAKALGKAVIHTDKVTSDIDWSKELEINHEKYTEYKRKYIKMDDTPEKQSWDIVIDHLEQSNE